MKKVFLMSVVLGGLVLLSTSLSASCVDSERWHCFLKGDMSKIPMGDCKNKNCPEGCVEAPDGTHGHCCPKVTETDCRMTVQADGCIKRKKARCLPTQYCDDQGKCQDKVAVSK